MRFVDALCTIHNAVHAFNLVASGWRLLAVIASFGSDFQIG